MTTPRRSAGEPSITRGAAVRGFTLMEVLVVVAIIAVVTGAVVLSVAGSGGERTLAREAERVQALVGFACERAQLAGRDIGISLARAGYRFSRFERNVWLPYREETLRPRDWPAGIAAALSRDDLPIRLGDDYPDKPQLLCYPSGELTAFRLDLAMPDIGARYRLDGRADGRLDLTEVKVDAR